MSSKLGAWSWWLGVGVIVLDQIAKYFVLTKKIFPVVENSFLPFGINSPGALNFLVVCAALAAFVFLSVKYFPGSPKSAEWNLIVGGAVSNLIDRIADGKVTDFINIGISTLNLADIAIWVGVLLFVFARSRATKQSQGQ